MFIRLTALILFFFPATSEWTGKVTAVIDGDTIGVLHDGQEERIRLSGIDCPEKAQAYGARAKQFTSDKIYGKFVKIVTHDTDRYGRTIADVYLQDGTWLNKALIEAGFAWHYKHYSKDEILSDAEKKAKEARFGLWQDNNPTPPWQFRKNR